MKKVFCFIMLCLYVLGVLGGIGYLCYYGVYYVAVGVAATGFLAFDKAKSYFDYVKP